MSQPSPVPTPEMVAALRKWLAERPSGRRYHFSTETLLDMAAFATEMVEKAEQRGASEATERDALIDTMRDILNRTAKELRGDPPPLSTHGWADLPQRAAAIQSELVDAVRAGMMNRAPSDIPFFEENTRRIMLAGRSIITGHQQQRDNFRLMIGAELRSIYDLGKEAETIHVAALEARLAAFDPIMERAAQIVGSEYRNPGVVTVALDHLEARLAQAERARDEQYRVALGMEFADGSPMLPSHMNPEMARQIFNAMRENNEASGDRAEQAERRVLALREALATMTDSYERIAGGLPALMAASEPDWRRRSEVKMTRYETNIVAARAALADIDAAGRATEARIQRAEKDRICKALEAWAKLRGADDESFRAAWGTVRLCISKSCLLDRMINLRLAPATEQCPVHHGQWSGIKFDDPRCECAEHGCGCTTGWLPAAALRAGPQT
jgi:hypothetical protein